MGIDYVLRSTNILYKDESLYYCKYAWRDINWKLIFKVLGINLGVLYDNYISYWTPEQVKSIRDGIQCIKDNPKEYLFNDFSDSDKYTDLTKEYLLNNPSEIQEQIKKFNNSQIDSLYKDIDILLDFFNFYVENNVYIDVI